MYFSIVIPTYKDSERLQLLLNALDAQTFNEKPWEVIIINNNPNEEINIEYQYPFNISIEKERVPGSYAARNKGVKLAKGGILAFTDSDCLPEPQWLETAFERFRLDIKIEIGILTGPVSLFYKDEKKLSDAELYEKYTGGFTTAQYAKEGHAITANWFSYKSVIQEFGGFNANLKSNGDSELSGKISAKYKIVYEPNLVVRHPARYDTQDLVNKYKRLIGGTYTRKYQGRKNAFRLYILDFFWKRYRFAFKKFFKLSPKESIGILRVCQAINQGVFKEYFHLVKGGETKR